MCIMQARAQATKLPSCSPLFVVFPLKHSLALFSLLHSTTIHRAPLIASRPSTILSLAYTRNTPSPYLAEGPLCYVYCIYIYIYMRAG